ncbi:uncharacterized protein METZ01_LOCUS475651, partial [marine metagenome]
MEIKKLFKFFALKFILVLIISFLGFGNIANAEEDCYRGTLDAAYCDR